ncbi:MAG TPA: chromate efflux transporter [Anaeromyxobacteraceae bacterium]|nr:chromate efflux transporter [Anaeromyxobacteraceae bacterium]
MNPAPHAAPEGEATAPIVPCSLGELLLYFVRLGTFGFGGPIVLAGHMQRDLVEGRRWISKRDYLEGLALAQLAPGPLAAQLAMYLGWVRAGVLGATLVSAAFILPSFAMTVAIAAAYLRLGGLGWILGAFYGIGAAVIAIIARSALRLTKLSLRRDRLLWAVFAVTGLFTAVTESEVVWLFLGAGVLALLVRAPPRVRPGPAAAAAIFPAWLVSGLAGPRPGLLPRLLGYFAAAGAFVFGSGLAIVPFLHGGVVGRYHWLTERQFLDAVAVAMITPGPVVITVAFIGYLVAGPAGAVMAGLGVFLPTYLFVVVPAPFYRRIAGNPQIHAFVGGVTAAATGAIAGAAIVLGRRALVDVPTVLIAGATLLLLSKAKRIPEPVVILAAGAAGVLLRRFAP